MEENTSTVHQEVFSVYGLAHESADLKSKVRNFLNRKLKRLYPDKNWNELSQTERNHFIYVYIKDDMLESYVPQPKRKSVETAINNFINNSSFEQQRLLKRENSIRNQVRHKYMEEYKSDYQNKQEYEDFCKQLKKYNPALPIPSYKDWCKPSPVPVQPDDYDEEYYKFLREIAKEREAQIIAEQKEEKERKEEEKKEKILEKEKTYYATSIYDYEQDYLVEQNIKYNDNESLELTHEVLKRHLIIDTILKALDEVCGIKINTEAMDEALSFLEEYNDMPESELLTEYDETLDKPKESNKPDNSGKPDDSNESNSQKKHYLSRQTQEKIIMNNEKYIKYRNMIQDLDFYTVHKKKEN